MVRASDKTDATGSSSKLAGHSKPERVGVQTGPIPIESIRERAKRVVSALNAFANRKQAAKKAMGLGVDPSSMNR